MTLLFFLGGVLLLLGWVVLRWRQSRLALQSASSALVSSNQFLGMMAHEMLTPLQVILSTVELIELGEKHSADDENFRRLRRSAQQLEAQMSDSVEFSRLSGGRLKVVPKLFRPDLMMQLIVAEYEDAARNRGVLLKVRVDPDCCPRVITDPARMRQIIGNLISNATKYAAPGEVLCSLRVHEASRRITVAIIDQGPGFDAGNEIWEPFVRGNQNRRGSGLGLAVVKLVAELLGGSARVVSRAGEGSAFIVQVPVEIESVPLPSRGLPLGDGSHHLRILLVQGQDEARLGMQLMLQAFGAQVELADDACEAAAKLAAGGFDGVLTALRLSDGDAQVVARCAHAAGSPNASTPVVVFSPKSATGIRRVASFAAVFDKPMTASKLRSALSIFAQAASPRS